MNKDQNETIEQPDVPDQKSAPKYQPTDLGYKKFNAGEHGKDIQKAKTLQGKEDEESREQAKRMEAVLAEAREKDQKIMRPDQLHALDNQIKLTKEDKNAPKKAAETKEKQSFMQLVKNLQENNKLPIQSDQESHIFEFRGLSKDNKDVKPEEVQKMLEHMDKGGELPPNVEFQFRTTFKKGREQNEIVDVDYRIGLHQIMRSGLESTLSSLLSLSYAAASSYDARKGKMKMDDGASHIEVGKQRAEKVDEAPLQNLRAMLAKKNLQTSTMQTNQWSGIEVSLPEKQKQFSIVYDGNVFQITEKRIDKTTESVAKTPKEVLEYIEKETN